MKTSIAPRNDLSLKGLSWPIAVEMFLQFMMGIADTLMVSHISDYAVSSVGLSNQVLNSINVLFITINSGAGIVVAQKLGAGLADHARKAAALAISANCVLGAAVGLVIGFQAEPIVRFMQAPAEVTPEASAYLSIVGAGSLIMALQSAVAAIVRNTGDTRSPMLIVMGMNAVHLVMNYLLVFGPFGIPQLGIVGVAVSTLASRLLALAVVLAVLVKSFQPGFSRSDWTGWPRPLVKEVWKIGWPMSVNGASWNYTQTIILAVVSSMGAASLTAMTYMNTLQSLPWLVGMSVAMASQIRVAHLYGAGQYEACYRSAFHALWAGLGYVVAASAVLWMSGSSLLALFTSNEDTIRLALPLLAINIALQPMKMVNQSFAFSLNGIGDTRYTALTNMISMWLVAALGAYVLGVQLGWGLAGVYAAMIADESVRAVLVAVRWIGRKRLSAQSVSIPE